MLASIINFLRRRVAIIALITIAPISVAGAATYHRFSVSSASGSGGASTFLQGSATGSALQGEVASAARTSFKIPFGVLGEYDANGSAFGIGVLGISSTGYAVAAEALGTQPSMLAYTIGSNPAMEAAGASGTHGDALDILSDSGYGANISSKTGIAVAASSGNTSETIYASNTSGYGVNATSPTAGLRGEGTANGVGILAVGPVNGQALYASGVGTLPTASFVNSGVASTNSFSYVANAGVSGSSSNGPGVYGYNSFSGTPNPYANGGGQNAGLSGYGNSGPGLVAQSVSSIGATIRNNDSFPTLFVNSDSADSNYEIAAASGNIASDKFNFTVDRSGNLYALGNIVSGSGYFQSASRNPNAPVASYSAQQTEATVEDFGSAQLVDGSASVALAPDFRQTIDNASQYMVFITPYGENHGLFISSRTSKGFMIRENAGGHSTISFDYRIVARPFGSHLARLPSIEKHRVSVKAFVNSAAISLNENSRPNTRLISTATSQNDNARIVHDKEMIARALSDAPRLR